VNILLVGSGGREHALAWKIRQSPLTSQLWIAPGNGGTAALGTNVSIADTDIPALVRFAREHAVDLVVAGPEAPLVLGLADALAQAGIPCFGPSAFAAQLEGSKTFAKTMMREAGVPTAAFAAFEDLDAALAYARRHPLPMVIKADGLAAGKGVVVATTLAEAETTLRQMMGEKAFGAAGERVIIEETLTGEEVSLLALCDGEHIAVLPSAQDHKRVGDGDTGPNTGGMGAYSPAPILPDADAAAVAEQVITPMVRHLKSLGRPFVGVIYAGLMMTAAGPMVLEYNVRFGDPECQPLMARLESDLVPIMLTCCRGELDPREVRFTPRPSCCVVLASQGYPGPYRKGLPISGLAEASQVPDTVVFHAGTTLQGDQLVTAGGRVLGVTSLGDTLAEAQARAYAAAGRIHFEGCFFRKDIAHKGIHRTP
jgi:phosphoribosylamine--glycine ligase